MIMTAKYTTTKIMTMKIVILITYVGNSHACNGEFCVTVAPVTRTDGILT